MSRLKNFSAFKFKENLRNIQNKKNIVQQAKHTHFQNLIEEGKRNDIVSVFLKKKSKVNESYSLILEDTQVMSDIKFEACKGSMRKGVFDLKNQSVSILRKYNISETEINEFENVFERLIFEKNIIQKFFSWASDKAKKVLSFLYDYVVKPGYDALRTCMVTMFGEETVAAVENIGKAVLKRLVSGFDQVTKTFGSIFDKTWKGLKRIAASITAVIMELVECIGKALKEIWKLIIFPVKAIMKKAEGPGTSRIVGLMEETGEKMKKEFETLSDHWTSLKSKLWEAAFKDEAKEQLEKGAKTILDSAESESDDDSDDENEEESEDKSEEIKDNKHYIELISYSLIGSVNRNKMNFEDVIQFYEKSNTLNEGSDVKKPHSEGYVKKWIIGTVTFVLSPVTKCIELITENLTKGVIALPGFIAGKGKFLELTKFFVYLPLLVAVIAGIIGDSLSVTGGIANYLKHPEGHPIETKSLLDYVTKPIEHAKHNIEKGLEVVGGVKAVAKAAEHPHLYQNSAGSFDNIDNITEKKKHIRTNFNEFLKEDAQVVIGGEKDVIDQHKDRYAGFLNLAATAGSAMIGFMFSIFLTTFPVAHIVFECLSVLVLTICLLGVVGETTELGKKIIPEGIVSAYHFIHGSH